MSSLETQVQQLQQQLQQLMQQLGENTPEHMQSDGDNTAQLHSFGTRPRYEWQPSEFLSDFLHLDQPIHTSPPLSDTERKSIIEAYPPIANLDYHAPITIPSALQRMNKGQKLEDQSLKHFQYLVSAVLRPLDILAHELASNEATNQHLEKYMIMLKDVRQLLLHVSSSLNHARNNVAMRAFNPNYSIKKDEGSYTLPLSEFQAALTEQTTERKNLREATYRKRNPRSSGTLVNNDNSFFRPGPSSQQGGLFLNNSGFKENVSSPNFQLNSSNNNNQRNTLNSNSNKRSYNPFRQQSQANKQQ